MPMFGYVMRVPDGRKHRMSSESVVQLSPYEEQQEITIQRARELAPNDHRLVESSGNPDVRTESFIVACEMLGEQA